VLVAYRDSILIKLPLGPPLLVPPPRRRLVQSWMPKLSDSSWRS